MSFTKLTAIFIFSALYLLQAEVAEAQGYQVIAENSRPPVMCVRVPERNRNQILRLKTGKIVNVARVRRSTLLAIRELTTLGQSSALTAAQRRRLRNQRQLRRFSRSCLSLTPPQDDSLRIHSLSRFGITWRFDRPYRFGHFANGDYWVIPDAPGESVRVVSVNPAPVYRYRTTRNSCSHQTVANDCTRFPKFRASCVEGRCHYAFARNGYDINPVGESKHAFDSRGLDYDDAKRPPPLPFSLEANSSLLSTKSNPAKYQCMSGPHNGWFTDIGECGTMPLNSASVLTVLGDAPAEGSFRPPYTGSSKPLHSSNSLRRELLLNLPPAASQPSIEETISGFERVWVDHKPGWSGQYIHPINNLPSYGATIATRVGIGALQLLTQNPAAKKEELLIHYVQTGIDLFGILQNGGYWPADGGHASGRKFPILFAGHMLNNSQMLSVGSDFPAHSNTFGEDCQTYYDSSLFSHFNGIEGFPLWGIRHCQDPAGVHPGYHDEDSPYRMCCNSESWVGQTLAARLLGLEHHWSHQAFFDYVDRYRHEGGGGYHGSGWSSNMWNLYRDDIDTCANNVRDRCSIQCLKDSQTFLGEQNIDCGGECNAC